MHGSDISDRMQRHRLTGSVPAVSPWLYFPRELERAYREDRNARHLARTRLIFGWASLLFLLGGLQDFVFLKSAVAVPAFAVQAFFIAPWMLACLAGTYAKRGRLHLSRLSLLAIAGAGIGMLAVIFYANALRVD